jgi:CHAD domain-containing protein
MGYAFELDESVEESVHRIADEQVGKAVASLEGADAASLDAAVHDCRKRAKKVRGLVRLVRPVIGDAYRPAVTAFRDAGRELSAMRDARAALATFDDLIASSPDRLPDGGLGRVRKGLSAAAGTATDADDRATQLAGAADLLRAGLRYVTAAKVEGSGWDALAPGLRRTYRDGRRALAEVRDDPSAPNVHEWRKRAKDAWYHVRLLEDAAPSVLGPLEERFHDLSDALGDAHDLVVIADRLRASPERFGGEDEVGAACDVADHRRRKLERRAVRLGSRLYAERPRAYVDRLGAYWDVWHEDGDEKAAGGIADLYPPDDDLDELDLEALRDRAGEAGLPGSLHPSREDLVGDLRATSAR